MSSASSRGLTLVLLLLLVSLGVGACASHSRPVLYPNGHLKSVGDDQGQADIDACMEFAASQMEKHRRGELALKEGAQGAVVGAAGGAAVSAVRGNSISKGAATGAAGMAAVGIVRGLWRGSEPDPIYKRFVEECLREKGYDPKGWR